MGDGGWGMGDGVPEKTAGEGRCCAEGAEHCEGEGGVGGIEDVT